ncbi:PREDICTED: uncharacterized protein LOC106329305 [Brassica oleracea var. oleracea]|uniref:uncharacterized protein LOC106329305 n=1 Tax=Brassica oleracea var. oleracea TaxID=109376 RepID=UPI0006A6DBFF|nr:PREDICTED: uncharacterized protein LOC106329305 [Brassica oleracea var. oleracea]
MQLTGIGNRNYSVKPLIRGQFGISVPSQNRRRWFFPLSHSSHQKKEGAKGDEITEDMIANSKTLAFNLVFGKNISLKQKKYAPKVFLRRPFAGSICEAYLKKYPAMIKRAPFC